MVSKSAKERHHINNILTFLHLITGKRVALASLVSWYNGTLGIRATKLADVTDITIQRKCRNGQGGVQES